MIAITRRRLLTASAYGLAAAGVSGLLPGSMAEQASAALADPQMPRSWGINTDIDVWKSYSASLDGAVTNISGLLAETTLPVVREGLGGGSGGNNLDNIRWEVFFNRYATELARTGRKMALQVAAENIPNPGLRIDAAWEARVTHKFRTVAGYLQANPTLRQAVAWLMICNEPDYDHVNYWDVPRLIRLHQLAYAAVKSVIPDLLVEGCTFADPIGKNLPFRDLLNAGVTRYCDFVGFHCYVQSTDGHSQSPIILLRNMRVAQQNFGWPMRPLVCSESGLETWYFDGRQGPTGWQALQHWQHLNYMQLARFGVSRCLYYSLGGAKDDMNLVECGNGYKRRPSFQTMIDAVQPRPLSTLNGSFRAAENKFSNWVVCWGPGSPKIINGQYPEWSQTRFMADGLHRAPNTTDNGYLQLDRGRPKAVRRVLDGLASRTYRVTAWVYQQGGSASLRVYGFDQNDCDRLVEAAATAAGRWVQLQVQFKPIKSIVGVDYRAVISLEHSGTQTCWWDNVQVSAMT